MNMIDKILKLKMMFKNTDLFEKQLEESVGFNKKIGEKISLYKMNEEDFSGFQKSGNSKFPDETQLSVGDMIMTMKEESMVNLFIVSSIDSKGGFKTLKIK